MQNKQIISIFEKRMYGVEHLHVGFSTNLPNFTRTFGLQFGKNTFLKAEIIYFWKSYFIALHIKQLITHVFSNLVTYVGLMHFQGSYKNGDSYEDSDFPAS